jgi:hypothetical protein
VDTLGVKTLGAKTLGAKTLGASTACTRLNQQSSIEHLLT